MLNIQIYNIIYIYVNLILIMIFGYMISLRYVAIIFAVDHMSQLGMCPFVAGWSCWSLREPKIFVRALSDAEIAWRGIVAIVVHLCYSAFICHARDGPESFRGIISARFDLSILSHQCTPCRPAVHFPKTKNHGHHLCSHGDKTHGRHVGQTHHRFHRRLPRPGVRGVGR